MMTTLRDCFGGGDFWSPMETCLFAARLSCLNVQYRLLFLKRPRLLNAGPVSNRVVIINNGHIVVNDTARNALTAKNLTGVFNVSMNVRRCGAKQRIVFNFQGDETGKNGARQLPANTP